MSGFIYLAAIVGVGWLVLWTIRDPKQPRWDWWPIDWWPFDTQSEEAAQIEAEKQAPVMSSARQAIPWRERGKSVRGIRRAATPARPNGMSPWQRP
jgi:hypothetical protein